MSGFECCTSEELENTFLEKTLPPIPSNSNAVPVPPRRSCSQDSPQSVSIQKTNNLYKKAENQVENAFKVTTPIARYFRALPTMDQMQRVKTDEKEYEEAYIIQLKIGMFFLKYLKTHPEYADFASSKPAEIEKARKLCSNSLKMAEIIKSRVDKI